MRGIPTRTEAQQLTTQPLVVTVIAAIMTAIQGSTTVTASISKGSTLGPTVERIYNDLESQGYTITDSGSTFTVSW